MADNNYVVSGNLIHGNRDYRDGEPFICDDAAIVAELVRSGALVVSAQRHAQMAVAQRLGGTTDVEVVLQRLRGERDSLLAKVASLDAQITEIVDAGQAEQSPDDQ